MKHVKLFEEYSEPTENIPPYMIPDSIDENECPVCGEEYVSQCKCMSSINHTNELLHAGHGKTCKNGHRWTYQTPDKKVLIMK